MNKFIFLDNDGVLNVFNDEPTSREDERYYYSGVMASFYSGSLLRGKVDMLTNFVLKHGLNIIVSSSWRTIYEDLEHLKKDYKQMGLPSSQVKGMTVNHKRAFSHHPDRSLEILATVNVLGIHYNNWVAFDDDINPFLVPNFIRTSPNEGLTEKHLEQAEKILGLK